MTESFKRGRPVVWRSRPQGHIGYVIPLVVVEDSPDAIALLQRDGCICMKRTGTRGGPRGRSMLPDCWDGGHAPVHWAPGHDVLRVHVPGTHHSVIRTWNAVIERFEGWYVNLESSWHRITIGFDTLDLVLDVVADGDLSFARFKDEDELAWAEKHGTVTPEEAQIARDEGRRVLALLSDRAGLFGCDWERWHPDPTWPVPELPSGWNVP